MATPVFDPQRVKTTLFNILIQGMMDGEMFTAEHREADVELHMGSDGFATYVVNANKSGNVSFMVSQMSPTNRLLSVAFNAGTIGMYQLEDLSDGTLVIGADARIEKHAPVKRGNKLVGTEWKVLVPKLVIQYGGKL